MKNPHYQQMLNKGLVICFFVVMSCKTKSNIDIQGHRGARGLYPENSLPAFEEAIDMGVTTLELDIAITKDNHVVVSHEPFMSRTICLKPNGEAILESEDMAFNIYQMTHEAIKQFDCGTKWHPAFPKQEKIEVYKPLLREVFALAKSKRSNVHFNIEIKSKPEYYGVYTPQPIQYVSLVLNEIERSGFFESVSIQSFDINILEEIKKQSPKMPVALLIDNDEDIHIKINSISFKPEIISPYYKLLDKTMVSNFRSKGFKVIPWTVNSKTDMQKMIDFRVDGIITDYPDALIRMVSLD